MVDSGEPISKIPTFQTVTAGRHVTVSALFDLRQSAVRAVDRSEPPRGPELLLESNAIAHRAVPITSSQEQLLTGRAGNRGPMSLIQES